MRPSRQWAPSRLGRLAFTASQRERKNLLGSSNVAKSAPESRRSIAFGEPGFQRLWERVTQWLFLAPALIYLLLFFGYPAVANVLMSLQHYTTSSFLTGEAPF